MQEMIRDREIAIQFLEKKIAVKDDRAERLKQLQVKTNESKLKKRQEHRAELMTLWKDYDAVLCRYQDAKDLLDMRQKQQQQSNDTDGQQEQNQGGSDAEIYNEIMNDVVEQVDRDLANGGAADSSSSYVVRMQSELCKAMHGMGIMETQRQMTKGQMELAQKKAKDVFPEIREEKSHVELKMVNSLILAADEKREVEGKSRQQHEIFYKEKNDLMEKIERQIDEAINNAEGNDGNNTENDAEEEEAKEELQGILQEGRAEMERIEKLIKEKQAKVEELKISAAMAQGQDVVDDIVTSIAEEFADGNESGDEGSEY